MNKQELLERIDAIQNTDIVDNVKYPSVKMWRRIKFLNLFLEVAEGLVPEKLNGYSLPDDYYLLRKGKKLIGDHRKEAYNQAIDQFKEKIEELRGGEK